MSNITIVFHNSLLRFTNGYKEIKITKDNYQGILLACLNLFPELDRFCREKVLNKNRTEDLMFISNNKLIGMSERYYIPLSNTIFLCPIIQGKSGDETNGLLLTLILYIAPPAAFKYGLRPFGIDFVLPKWVGIGATFGLSLAFDKITDKLDPKPFNPTGGGIGDRLGVKGINPVFDGPKNAPPFSPVPLHYGNIRVAGQFVSGTVNTVNHGPSDNIKVGDYFE